MKNNVRSFTAGNQNELSIEQMLSYKKNLDGDLFCQHVLTKIELQNKRGNWVLAGMFCLATLLSLLIKPTEFRSISISSDFFTSASVLVSKLPFENLTGILILVILLIGMTHTVEHI